MHRIHADVFSSPFCCMEWINVHRICSWCRCCCCCSNDCVRSFCDYFKYIQYKLHEMRHLIIIPFWVAFNRSNQSCIFFKRCITFLNLFDFDLKCRQFNIYFLLRTFCYHFLYLFSSVHFISTVQSGWFAYKLTVALDHSTFQRYVKIYYLSHFNQEDINRSTENLLSQIGN